MPDNTDHRTDLYLVDGSSYLYRAYYAIRQGLSNSAGMPTGAVYGITSMLLKILKDKNPRSIAIVWDAKGPVFRHALYDNYKANRPPMPEDLRYQVPWVRQVVEAMGLPQLEMEGYEADDIIATLATAIDDRTVVIVSGDKDLSQLASERVIIWDNMKNKVLSGKSLLEETGIEAPRLLDVQALSGDTADNIPGVKGIGPKTALKLIREYGSIENLYENIDRLPKGKMKERLIKSREEVKLWKRLVTLARDVPVSVDPGQYLRRSPSHSDLVKIFHELEFSRLLKDLKETFPDIEDKDDIKRDKQDKVNISYDRYENIFDEDSLRNWVEKIKLQGRVCIDTETTSHLPSRAKLVGISMCVTPPEACYIPVGHISEEQQIPLDAVKKILGPVLADREIKKTGQNIKYDIIVLERAGFKVRGVDFDTMIASYLIDPAGAHGLDALSMNLLNHKMISFKEVTSGIKGEGKFAKVRVKEAVKYACEDAHVTRLISDILKKRLKEEGVVKLFNEVEMPLVPILADMEMAGIHVDINDLERLSKELEKELESIKIEIFELAGEKFNINSPAQLSHILFEKLKLPPGKKTKKKTGYSTDIEVLTALAKVHPLPAAIVEFRNTAKLKSTYVDSLKGLVNPETNRIHTSFNQTVTGTGRLSSSEPNLQNIPVSKEKGRSIRRLFTATTGNIFLSADYSQIDLRVLAHYAHDKTLVNAFRNGKDIHTETASEIFQVHPDLVTSEMRRAAKSVNFGIVYGMSAYGLSKELDISRKEAATFIDRYFNRYPGVKKFMEAIVEQTRKTGYAETIAGRKRFLPEINSKNRQRREFAERQAINTPVQGSAADIIKLAMIKIFDKIVKPRHEVRLLLQVHDELLFEGPVELVYKSIYEIKKLMEEPVKLEVPLEVVLKTGINWADMEEYDT